MIKFYNILIPAICLLFACRSTPPLKMESHTGTFKSLQGVLNPISCYCGNGGYLQTEEGKEIPVCLEENQEVTCLEITVTGPYVEQKAPEEPTTPCPSGTMTILMVRNFECK